MPDNFRKLQCLLLAACLAAGMAGRAEAGSVQFSTYYPAPFGIYDRLRLPPRAALGEPCGAGAFYYETGVGLRVCDEATQTWGSLGGVWTQSGNNIYPSNTATNPGLKVGIGTTAPGAPLHINHNSGTGLPFTASLRLSKGNDFWEFVHDATGSLLIRDDDDVAQGKFSYMWRQEGGGFGIGVDPVGPTVADGAFLRVRNTNNAYPNLMRLEQSDGTGVFVVVENTGNVGIGTTSPGAKLDVRGTIVTSGDAIEIGAVKPTGNQNAYLDLRGDDLYTDYGLRLLRGNTGPNTWSQLAHRGTNILYITTQDAAPISFQTSSLDRLYITPDGNVGIGTTAPGARLHINGTLKLASVSTPNAGAEGNMSWFKPGGNYPSDCNENSERGVIKFAQRDGGIGDRLCYCRKEGTGEFFWHCL